MNVKQAAQQSLERKFWDAGRKGSLTAGSLFRLGSSRLTSFGFKRQCRTLFKTRCHLWLLVVLALGGVVESRAAAGNVVAWGNYAAAVPKNAIDVRAIAAGDGFSLALKANGTVVAWGNNSVGQTDLPPGLTNVAAVAAGWYHGLALRSNGTVVAWSGWGTGLTNLPSDLTNVVGIAAGASHSLALRSDGTVVAWGSNGQGQTDVPTGLTDVVAITADIYQSMALRRNGTVAAWGYDGWGLIEFSMGLTDVAAIAAGAYHSLVLRSNGTVFAWGNNYWGQTNVPLGMTDIQAIAAGSEHSVALRSNGTVVAWGNNSNCQLNFPFGLTNVIAIAAGSSHSLALLSHWPPVILLQPTNQTVLVGRECTLSAEAKSSDPFVYQWRFHGNKIQGATNSQLTFAAVQFADEGEYSVVTSNAFGSETSQTARLTVVFRHEFNAPEGPPIWDFSGTYPSPLMTLQQQYDGILHSSSGGQGAVSGNGSSVGLNLLTTRPPGDYIAFSSTHIEILVQNSCTTTLTLDPVLRNLVGVNSCLTVGQDYVWFLGTWNPVVNGYGVPTLTTRHMTTPISQPLPDGVDGHWELVLDVAAGRAFVILSGGNIIQFELTGTNTTANNLVLNLQGSPNYLTAVTTGPEMLLQSIHGTVAGQSVDFGAPAGTAPLTLNKNGDGQVAVPRDAQDLVLGKDYTLRATPRPGNLFSNWVINGVAISTPILRFTMTSNLVIAANFVPNPFPGLKGHYTGLFYDTNAPAHENAGFFTLAVTDQGAFNGKLQQGAAKYSLKGQFDLALSAQKTVLRKGTNDVVVRLQLTSGSDRLFGTVSNAAWSSELFGYRAGFNPVTHPATNFQGRYTLLLPGTEDATKGPMGHGFARLTVANSGRVSFIGTLADGSPVMQTVPLAAHGQWPLYVSEYQGQGSILGWLSLLASETNDVTGRLLWTKPSGLTGAIDANGFTNSVEIVGSRYFAPRLGERVMDLTNAVILLGGGDLAEPLTNDVILDQKNRIAVTPPNLNQIDLVLAPASGTFSGSFLHPRTGLPTRLKGVVLQQQNLGGGFFLGTNQSGSAILRLRP